MEISDYRGCMALYCVTMAIVMFLGRQMLVHIYATTFYRSQLVNVLSVTDDML